MNSVDLTVKISDELILPCPIMPASGCFGYGEEGNNLVGMDLSKLGAIVSKGSTLEKRDGNPQPRVWETASGMINCIGLENPGIDVVIKDKIPFMAQFGVPVIINISGFSVEDFGFLAEKLHHVDDVSALEVNISCPNIKEGKLPFGTDPEIAEAVVEEVRLATDLPLIVKLTPNVTDIVKIAQKVEQAGADSISLINTLKGAFAYHGKIVQGGLSGPAIKPVALAMVSQVVQSVSVPVIGVGGISSLQDIFDFFKVGACAVQVGTACYKNPLVLMELITELEEYCQEKGIENLSQLRK